MNHANADKAEKGYTIYTGAFQGHSEVEFMILQHKVTRLEKQIEAMKDEYHTMRDLYEHRTALFGFMCSILPSWKSKLHNDGSMYDGYFIAGIENQPISYHMPLDRFDMFPAKEIEKAPEWNGYTPHDVVISVLSMWGLSSSQNE